MFSMFASSTAYKQAQEHSDILTEALDAEATHMNDKKKKQTEKKAKATKADKVEVELQAPTKKEMEAWREQVKVDLKNCEAEETSARRGVDDFEDEERAWITSWRNDVIKRRKAKEAGRKGRGIVSHSAVRRLTRELKIIMNDPSWGVAAKPVDDNLLLWHCNVAAPGGLTGKGTLHLELEFPQEYPAVPPKVKILGADVEHPNIFGTYICLDMLEKGEFETAEHTLKPYTGWSSAYGVQAILRQLQSFFYSRADSGDTKGRINIKPWSGLPTWEYQLDWDECNHWRDWVWDPFSFCGHSDAKPGHCTRSYCNSKGRLTRRWIKMHDADVARLETLHKKHEKDEDVTVWHPVVNPVFARKIKPKRVFYLRVNFAVGLEPNLGMYHESLKYNAKPTYAWRPYVTVSFGGQTETTSSCPIHLVNNDHPNAKSYLPKVAGPTTPTWMTEFKFVPKSYNHTEDVVFEVYDKTPKGTVLLGVAKYPIREILNGKRGTGVEITVQPEETDSRKHKKKGSKLYIDFNVPEHKGDPVYEYKFAPQGLDGDFYQRSGFTGSIRRVRRRQGYRCDVCDHSPIECNPPLPCAIDCDDAPPFALEAFHKAMLEAAGSNPQAMKAVERCMASLEEEKMEKSASKLTDLPHDAIMTIMEYLPRNRERRYMASLYQPWDVLYKDAKFWEAQHLKCFTTGAAPHEDLLGIGVTAAEAMHGRPVFTCQFDAMSYTAYSEGVRIGVWKEPLTHWIPLFINKIHATQSMPKLLPMLSRLSVGVRSSTSAWTVCGAGIDGKGKGNLKRVADVPGHVFRATGWAGLRGGSFCASGCHYFQICIDSYQEIPGFKIAGRLAAHGVVKIGWVTMNGDVNLGTDKYGFCLSSNGHKVHDAVREDYTEALAPGSIVGTLWNADKRTISYFVNGKALGTAFNVPKSGDYPGLIPAVGLSNATIEVDIEGGYNPPCKCETETLGAHERVVSKNVSNCLTVLPQLMNHMVVDVMKGTLHASVKALQGYCAIHRLLLHCCETIPGVQDEADKQIQKFIDHPAERHKVLCPDLGILLCLLTISKRYWWEDLRNPFMTELFARHVRWSLKKSKRFAAGILLPKMAKDSEMIEEAFFANETSCKLVMFQVFFCNLVKPSKEELDDYETDDFFSEVKSHYDSRMGFPTEFMTDALVEQIKTVNTALTVGWNGFLTNIGGQTRNVSDIAKRIRDAVARSNLSGYHADVTFPDKPYAAKLLRMPPRPRPKPGEKFKPAPKRAPKKEKLAEDDYGAGDDGYDKYD
eukprot:TRINITY_DN1432_c0_g1_i1.p1 TRINITY_DN1432_c0_g1~~TRINITY_DN1432_c0_g1_i1.p1  ORF type:complete len:1268 (+),score=451.33 TRINITY_DN1432_c0_g1_i1:65-3868(+)